MTTLATAEAHPGPTADPGAPLLDIRGLRIGFGPGRAIVDGVDLSVARGRLLCLVGESGSGKSLTALSIMRLLPPAAQVMADRYDFDGVSLTGLSEAGVNRLRGDRIAMVFQEPMTSLNPVMTIGEQMTEILAAHRGLGRAEARTVALDMVGRVQIPDPEARLAAYPHQLSGGMRQRIMIAMALICRPALLIADEPTTALDVTIQSQILRLIDDLRAEFGTAVLFITHNLAVVAEIADEVAVMYAGRIVERASRRDLFDDPMHPYTLSLFAAMPRAGDVGRRLASIEGQVPQVAAMPAVCRFAPRCPFAVDRCRAEDPPLRAVKAGHLAACWRAPLEESAGA
ncbi:ABC transporter ATP-binding protein [Alsobacter sp. KACC 23698]|uniref:ABC transporter ATP-binding protein n=1 Tax=Alsobacter sp. KACC 23698 TaxID=3149229 RepID=A0AAU7JLP8_9HYPH